MMLNPAAGYAIADQNWHETDYSPGGQKFFNFFLGRGLEIR